MNEGRTSIQRDIESLEEWSHRKFNKDKCKVLQQERKDIFSGTGWGSVLQKTIWVFRQRTT